jgi:hypothetical protein
MLVVAAFMQAKGKDRDSAFTFAGLACLFSIVSVPDDHYYFAAGLTDAICILILATFYYESVLARGLMEVSKLSFILNLAGYVNYEILELSPAPYRNTFIVFYSVVILSLFIRGARDAYGSTTTNTPWIPFSFHSYFISDRECEKGGS